MWCEGKTNNFNGAILPNFTHERMKPNNNSYLILMYKTQEVMDYHRDQVTSPHSVVCLLYTAVQKCIQQQQFIFHDNKYSRK